MLPEKGNSQPTFESTPMTAMAPEQPKKEAPPNIQEQPPKKRKTLLIWFTFLLILIAAACVAAWFLYFQFHESTDDAYSNGSMINLNSPISGSVIAFYADNTDLVTEGQLLVSLDKTDYQIAYDMALAKLAAVVLQVRQIYHNVNVAKANVEIKKIAVSKAKFDYENRSELHKDHPLAVSNEDYIHSQDDLHAAEADLKLTEYQLKAAIDAAGNTPLTEHPQIEEQKNAVREAFYNLEHCSIYAPHTGYIAQRSVDVGQRVSPLVDLMAIIPTDYVWVDANFKETQLTYMRVGQPATVWFDMYGSDVMFEGKVLGIASGSGSVFSLIPPQNATGNWIKIVQRLPVRISLNKDQVEKYPIRLGVSAEVNVNISDHDLPMLVQKQKTNPVTTTKVFDLNFEEVDKIIDEVIKKNLMLDKS